MFSVSLSALERRKKKKKETVGLIATASFIMNKDVHSKGALMLVSKPASLYCKKIM